MNKPISTVLEKAALWFNHRENIEPWWVQNINTDLPRMFRETGVEVDLSHPGVRNAKDGGTFPVVIATKA